MRLRGVQCVARMYTQTYKCKHVHAYEMFGAVHVERGSEREIERKRGRETNNERYALSNIGVNNKSMRVI